MFGASDLYIGFQSEIGCTVQIMAAFNTEMERRMKLKRDDEEDPKGERNVNSQKQISRKRK